MSFKVGDTVMLKSGGPKMTIANTAGADGKVGVQWFNIDSGKFDLQSARIDPGALKPA